MNLRGILVLLVSVGLAWLAMVAANRWMEGRLASAKVEVVDVVAAAADIPFGTQIDATLIKMVGLPAAALPEKVFRDPQQVIGRVAATTLFKGEPLIEGRVVEHLGGSALAAVVPEGKRAITVRVNDVIGVAGFMLPGNRVDLISIKGGSGGARTETMLRNLKVLAVDQTASQDKNDPVLVRAVTLQVDPNQAEEIAEATNEGKVQFTLRNPMEDNREAPPTVAETEQEESVQPPPAPPAVASNQAKAPYEPETVLVIRRLHKQREFTGLDFARDAELRR
ncbi:Flp pilus assembly protein CpaB [Thiorhodococcus minor]|uniref:Flp pilus assembly protein CpaB n=1 Tax=Thiorhodococcus minor TaxID=57489 RepID=A0A6M0JZW2_9GAMM|nr:Flp pilus assembly protein CpaB [Thiorhodococcus minor]NEV63022.1 Flp pilus assembly protein CpaB [Thiorhodococcus minor]